MRLLSPNSRISPPGLAHARHQIVASVASGAVGRVVVYDFATTSWVLATPGLLRRRTGPPGLILRAVGASWLIQQSGITDRTATALSLPSTATHRCWTLSATTPGALSIAVAGQPVLAQQLPDGRVLLSLDGAPPPDDAATASIGTWTWYTTGSGTHTFGLAGAAPSPARRFMAYVCSGGGAAIAAAVDPVGYIAATSGGSPTTAIRTAGIPGYSGSALLAACVADSAAGLTSISYAVGAAAATSHIGGASAGIRALAPSGATPGYPDLDPGLAGFDVEWGIGSPSIPGVSAGLQTGSTSYSPGLPGLLLGPNSDTTNPYGKGAAVGGTANGGLVGIFEHPL